jgi:hypothetical protein
MTGCRGGPQDAVGTLRGRPWEGEIPGSGGNPRFGLPPLDQPRPSPPPRAATWGRPYRDAGRVEMRKPLWIFGVFGSIAFWPSAILDPRPGSEPITISVEDGRLHGVFKNVAAQVNARLWISPGVENVPVSFSAEGVPVRDVLSDLCERDRCRWKMVTSIVVWDRREPTPEWSLSPDEGRPCQP